MYCLTYDIFERGSMQRFLVLGVGNAQVDLLHYLKDIFELHSCSNINEGRGIELCDYFEKIDIKNIDRTKDYCQKNRIDYIYSIGSDVAMPTIAKVSEMLNLPCFTSYQTALSCNSKNIFRHKLKDISGAIKFQTITSIDHDSLVLPFPLMIKPADSQGQRGVCLVNSYEEMEAAFFAAKEHSNNGIVLAEEYIDGPEISVNAFIEDAEIIFSILSDRISWPDSKGGAIHKHLLPCSLNAKAQENTLNLVKCVIKSLNIDNGPVYFQIKMKGDEPKLIEVTPRLDGCHMWRLIKLATGIDLLEMTIKYLTKREVGAIPEFHIKEQCLLEFFCSPPNSIIDNNNFEIHPNNIYHEFYYNNGERVKEINGYMEKCGYQIFRR